LLTLKAKATATAHERGDGEGHEKMPKEIPFASGRKKGASPKQQTRAYKWFSQNPIPQPMKR